jgi:tRNA modification GTPase
MAFCATSKDTIFALSSAPGRAGVAVIRVSGKRAGDALRVLAAPRPEPRRAALRRITDPETGAPIDRGFVLWFPGPHTFTGEDVAELQIHGGRAVVAALLSALGRIEGCRLAEPGEFAMRAFENGHIDLAQAEGLADLIDAETEAQRSQALRQAEGALTALTERWRGGLIAAMALVEAAIDFSDESDVSENAIQDAEGRIAVLRTEIAHHLDDGHRGELLRDGFSVVLVGAPNVGKSSLLNALARRDVAIVSAEEGTTRDVIEVRLDLDGFPVVVSDTAGLRETTGEIEVEGIRRTLSRSREANLLVWVIDASLPPTETESAGLPEQIAGISKPVLIAANKCDLAEEKSCENGIPCTAPSVAPRHEIIRVSARTGEGLNIFIRRIAEFARATTEGASDPVITQARHRQHIADCMDHLADFSGRSADVELRAEDLRLAANALGRISGRIDPEEVLGQVFGRFCIGK